MGVTGSPTDIHLSGGFSRTTRGEGAVRGIGHAVGIKNAGFSGGFGDCSTSRLRREVVGGEPVATVRAATAEAGAEPGSAEAAGPARAQAVGAAPAQPSDTRRAGGGPRRHRAGAEPGPGASGTPDRDVIPEPEKP